MISKKMVSMRIPTPYTSYNTDVIIKTNLGLDASDLIKTVANENIDIINNIDGTIKVSDANVKHNNNIKP
jgi:hypothetical protein